MKLKDESIIFWIHQNNIVTESGVTYDIENDHFFWYDYLRDFHPWIVLLKPPQIGASIANNLKMFYISQKLKLNLIYTLPTASDRDEFVKTKVNPLISNNPPLKKWLTDTDNLSQKQLGNNWIYFRGTFNEKDAMMFTSDLNIHDEDDASNQAVIKGYQSRYQHSKFKGEWHFSHPSDEDYGVDEYWKVSDQRHWFITCKKCKAEQYMTWPENVCLERRIYQCKECYEPLTERDRMYGRWVAKRTVGSSYCKRCTKSEKVCDCGEDTERFKVKYHGYWVTLLMCAWVPAEEVIEKSQGDAKYFYNKVLGLPFAGTEDKLTKAKIFANLTDKQITPDTTERVIIGIDTGPKLDFVIGGRQGLFYNAEATTYEEIDVFMERWPNAIAIIDAGGDYVGAIAFKEKWKGRVFSCYLTGDSKTTDEVQWDYEECIVRVQRDKFITQVVGEFNKKLIPLQGNKGDWYQFALDWGHLRKKKIVDKVTGQFKGHKWIRSKRDHRALATVFWRVGYDEFCKGMAKVVRRKAKRKSNTIHYTPDQKAQLPSVDKIWKIKK